LETDINEAPGPAMFGDVSRGLQEGGGGQDDGAIPKERAFDQQLPCTLAHPGFCRRCLIPQMKESMIAMCALLKTMAIGTFFGMRFKRLSQAEPIIYYKVLALNDILDRMVLLVVDVVDTRPQLSWQTTIGFDLQMVQSALYQVRLCADEWKCFEHMLSRPPSHTENLKDDSQITLGHPSPHHPAPPHPPTPPHPIPPHPKIIYGVVWCGVGWGGVVRGGRSQSIAGEAQRPSLRGVWGAAAPHGNVFGF
jgi:hypothetical protein